MAIKSSGSLRLRYDIAAEVNGASSNISLGDLSNVVGFANPDAMSEFYGYSSTPPNLSAWLGRNTYFRNVLQQPQGTFYGGITMMGWFRPNYPYKKNQILFGAGGSNRTPRNEIRAHYIASLNRIQVAVYDQFGVRRIRREYPLHNSPNVAITGVSNSSTGWERDQVGYVDTVTGLAHLAVTWEGPNFGGSYTGLKLFWRGVELTYSVNNNTSSTIATAYGNYIAVRNVAGGGASFSTFDGYTDNVGFFKRVLTPFEVSSVFNKGNINVESAVVSSGMDIAELAYYQGFEGSLTAEQGGFVGYTLQLNGSNGSYYAYP